MQVLSGELRNTIVHIGPRTAGRGVCLRGCTVSAGPHSSFLEISGLQIHDCVFLYDGMEVDIYEWTHLMRRGALLGQPLPPQRTHAYRAPPGEH